MADDGLETFEISEPPQPEPARPVRSERRTAIVADRKFLCVTVVDHNPVIDGTGEESYINIRVPVSLAEAGLRMIPDGKLGRIQPELIVEMIEDGAMGELINIKEEKKSISIRVE
jgi:hypothetical protein